MSFIQQDLYCFDDFVMRPSRRTVTRRGEKVPVAPKTFEVLLCLAENAGRVVTKEELLKTVWPDSFVEESNLSQHIFWLRKALAEKADYIVTVPGIGYEFTVKVTVVPESVAGIERPADSTEPALAFRVQQSTEQTRVVFKEIDSPTASLPVRQSLRRWLIWSLAIAVPLIAVAGWRLWRNRLSPVPGDHHEVVLADFENSTGDPDLDHSLKTLLAMDLNESPLLVVASDAEVRKTLRLMNRSPDEALSGTVAGEICQRLNDQVVLAGLVARFDGRYLVTLKASSCSDGKELVGTKAVANAREDLLKAVDHVAAEMRSRLGEPLVTRGQSSRPLEAVHTFSLEALKAYTDARSVHLSNKMLEAIPLYQRAIALDPNFASAYTQLALCYINTGQGKLADGAMAKAYELRDYTDGFDRVRITALYEWRQNGDSQLAIRNYQTATRLYPLQSYPWVMLGGLQGDAGHYDEAIASLKRGLELSPTAPSALPNLAIVEAQAGRLDEAKETIGRTVAQKIDYPEIHEVLVNIAYQQHDDAAFKREMLWLKQNSELDYDYFQAEVLFGQGRTRDGIALVMKAVHLDRSEQRNDRASGYLGSLARAEAEMGMTAEARAALKSIGPLSDMKNTIAGIDALVATAMVSNPAEAEAVLARRIAEKPSYTAMNDQFGPQVKAAAAMSRGRPAEAIALLQSALPYDFTTIEVPLQRGMAYLALRQAEQARLEFRKIVDHPYTDPLSSIVAMAHLGLARALAMEGNAVASRQEYETLFKIWKDADADLPALSEARAEYAHLS